MIALAYGRVGLRDLRSQLFRWRVGVRWYAVALLTLPLLVTAILFALSLTSKAFLPAIITAEDKASLLVTGLVAGAGHLLLRGDRLDRVRYTRTQKAARIAGDRTDLGPAVGRDAPAALPVNRPVGLSRRRSYVAAIFFSFCCPTGCSWCGSTTVPRAC